MNIFIVIKHGLCFFFVWGAEQSLTMGSLNRYDKLSATTCHFNWPYTYGVYTISGSFKIQTKHCVFDCYTDWHSCKCNCGGAVSRLYYVVKREVIYYIYIVPLCVYLLCCLSNIPATAGQDHSSLPTLGH